MVFHSDLDHTLIYSYKYDIGLHKRCVEIYQNREISYMTELSAELLNQVQVKVQAIRQVVVHKIQVLVMGQIRQVKVKHRPVQLRKIKQILMGKIRIKLLQ